MPPPRHSGSVDRSFPTDARAEPARPDGGAASGASRRDLRLDEAELLQLVDHDPRRFRRLVLLRLDAQLRRVRLLVRVGHAGELFELAPEGLLVQALHVAAGALL